MSIETPAEKQETDILTQLMASRNAAEVEMASFVQLKYAVLMNTEVESLLKTDAIGNSRTIISLSKLTESNLQRIPDLDLDDELEIEGTNERPSGKVKLASKANATLLDTTTKKASVQLLENDITIQFSSFEKSNPGIVQLHGKMTRNAAIFEGDGKMFCPTTCDSLGNINVKNNQTPINWISADLEDLALAETKTANAANTKK